MAGVPSLVALVLAGCGSNALLRPNAGTPTGSPPGLGPRFARTVELRTIAGTVRVSPPGNGGRFLPLVGTRLEPTGTVVDTTLGVVQMTAALPNTGRTNVGEFMKGLFRITQLPIDGGLTDLAVLDQGTVRGSCGHGRLSPILLGLLLGQAQSGFRTDGEFASATVRGTKWGVRDRCDGTLVVDREGVVVVTVYHPQRVLTLQTGQTFLARAP